jgi:DNA-binding response OmpR family regulator
MQVAATLAQVEPDPAIGQPRTSRPGRAVVGIGARVEDVIRALTDLGLDARPCATARAVLELVHALAPELVILDLGCPTLDALDVCRQLRQESPDSRASRVPIILLAAEEAEVDVVVGLEVGADDVLRRPVSARLILARARALLRRVSFGGACHTPRAGFLSSGDLTLNLVARQAVRDGHRLRLTPREFDLLAFLARRAGTLVTRDEIISGVWRDRISRESGTLNVHVSSLRSKIERHPSHPVRLQTMPGHGYVFRG